MAIRAGDWKLVRYDVNADTRTGGGNQGVTAAKLYNLATDIGETNDLAAVMPDRVKKLQSRWNEWNKSNLEPLWGGGAAAFQPPKREIGKLGPVDSPAAAAWREMKAARAAGKLTPGLNTTCFSTPRMAYELYDLEAELAELNNLSGKLELANVEREQHVALAEKMILDFDYLPLPAIGDAGVASGGRGNAQIGRLESRPSAPFARHDTDGEGAAAF
jgi:hypothetical protein